MASSGMLFHVALVRTDVSKERSASIIRLTRIGEIGTTLGVTSNQRTLRRNTLEDLLTSNKDFVFLRSVRWLLVTVTLFLFHRFL
jgi:hypothetical protein